MKTRLAKRHGSNQGIEKIPEISGWGETALPRYCFCTILELPNRSWLGKGLANDVGLRFVNDREGEGTIEGPATVTCMAFR